MSTGAECYFTETAPGRWTYWLQDWPYGESPDGETFGPFMSFRAATDHLHDNHANPGGYSVHALPEGQHLHEWETGSAQVQVGLTVQIDVETLGPDATQAEVVAFIQTLPVDHPAWRTWALRRFRDGITDCASCGKRKED